VGVRGEGRTEVLFEVDFDIFEEGEGDGEDEAVFAGSRHGDGVAGWCLVGGGGGSGVEGRKTMRLKTS
jgi:hypothetical protein